MLRGASGAHASSSWQFNPVTPSGKGPIRDIAVTLHLALEVHGDDVLQKGSCPAGLPAVKHVSTGFMACPEITLPGLPVTGFQIIHRSLIHLDIATTHHPGEDMFIDGLQPPRGQFYPPRQTLPRQLNPVALPVNLFLPVEGQMVAVLADQNVGQQAGSRQAAVQ